MILDADEGTDAMDGKTTNECSIGDEDRGADGRAFTAVVDGRRMYYVPQIQAALAAEQEKAATLRGAVQLAVDVFAMLDAHPGMLGHYLDTDENDGERFRRLADSLGIVPTPEIDESIAALDGRAGV